MKKEILQILQDASIPDGLGYEERHIRDSDFDLVADAIIEMLNRIVAVKVSDTTEAK